MTSIEEFIKMREGIENLAAQIALSIERKDVTESRKHLDTANRQLEVLKTMIANDTQEMVGRRLSAQLEGFAVRIEKMKPKMPVKRRAERKERTVPKVRPSNTETLEIVMFERP
jgi:uncharacterized Zn finger protein